MSCSEDHTRRPKLPFLFFKSLLSSHPDSCLWSTTLLLLEPRQAGQKKLPRGLGEKGVELPGQAGGWFATLLPFPHSDGGGEVVFLLMLSQR